MAYSGSTPILVIVDRNSCGEEKGMKEDTPTIATSVKVFMLNYDQLVVVCYGIRRLAIGVEEVNLAIDFSRTSRCGSWLQEAER